MQVSFLGTKMQVSKADMMCLLVLSRQQRQALTLAFPRSPACQVTGLSPAFPTRHSSQQIFAKKCQKKVDTLVVFLPVGGAAVCACCHGPPFRLLLGWGGLGRGLGGGRKEINMKAAAAPPRRQRAELAAHRRALGGGVACRTLTGWVPCQGGKYYTGKPS